MQMKERAFAAQEYTYGFNGQEQDGDLMDGAVVFKYRIHDPRIGKFLSVDPLTTEYPYYTPYQFAGNEVISSIDVEGAEPQNVIHEGESYVVDAGPRSLEVLENMVKEQIKKGTEVTLVDYLSQNLGKQHNIFNPYTKSYNNYNYQTYDDGNSFNSPSALMQDLTSFSIGSPSDINTLVNLGTTIQSTHVAVMQKWVAAQPDFILETRVSTTLEGWKPTANSSISVKNNRGYWSMDYLGGRGVGSRFDLFRKGEAEFVTMVSAQTTSIPNLAKNIKIPISLGLIADGTALLGYVPTIIGLYDGSKTYSQGFVEFGVNTYSGFGGYIHAHALGGSKISGNLYGAALGLGWFGGDLISRTQWWRYSARPWLRNESALGSLLLDCHPNCPN
jgi:RHS repeat-associated protein